MMIVAEVSANHKGSIETAFAIIDAAHMAGADAVKFQTFSAEEMAIPGYTIPGGTWGGRDLLDLYGKAETPLAWHHQLFEYAKSLGLIAFSTPFSVRDVEFLETLGCPMYKIASFEIVDLRLIAAAAMTGKPLIMSTGMASKEDIRAAVCTADDCGCLDITLLHCVSEYPAPVDHMNLATMKDMEGFGCKVGLSDHSRGVSAPIAATALGATMIEKHLTVTTGTLDEKFSLKPHEFRDMVTGCKLAKAAIGKVTYEVADKAFRRSLYYAEDLEEGTILEDHHIKTARPNLGRSPIELGEVLGTVLSGDVKANEPVPVV